VLVHGYCLLEHSECLLVIVCLKHEEKNVTMVLRLAVKRQLINK
jgi:hypothetical protein